ncbi:MAG: glycosyl hydrolase [Eubacteriales bacterium]
MLYKKKCIAKLDDALFANPTSEYRATPFWSWNCKLDRDELLRQIEVFKKMGLGGFHMHVRSGLATEYLSDEFMSHIRACAVKARDEGMLAYLYDEDRWPSGFAGGLVTKDPEYRINYLLFTPNSYEALGNSGIKNPNEQMKANRTGNGSLIGKYDVVLNAEGKLASYRLIDDEADAVGKVWYAYNETPDLSPRYNGYTYADTMNKAAIDRFIEITHERYKDCVGDMFGDTVPSIFTDEPQFTHKKMLPFPESEMDITLPWTRDIEDSFKATYGFSLIEHIPELIWELADGVSQVRYFYHDHACERFATSFADNIGKWCDDHGIALTGHMMKEPTLDSQTMAVGEAMRSLRAFAIPGIDMLADRHEYTTAKQAASVAHQYGREGVMSELYGVTGWDYDFRGHKLQGDWQAALGVTLRVPHLSWVSMEGESKRDYPATINYQSPWFEKYSYVENHFARVNTALVRGVPNIKVGVIHPVESFWLHCGPSSQTALERQKLDRYFDDVTNWLLFGSIDFDYISESLIPDLCDKGSNPMRVGKMAYDVIVVPGCETLRSTTISRLEQFCADGGKLIFMGDAPKYADALPSNKPAELCARATHIAFTRSDLLCALDSYRIIDIKNGDGCYSDNLVHQIRRDGDGMWLFIAKGKNPSDTDCPGCQRIKITVRGLWKPTLYNTLDGTIAPKACKYIGGNTVIDAGLWSHDSLLFKLEPNASQAAVDLTPSPALKLIQSPRQNVTETRFKLHEPNALLLDIAEYALDGEDFKQEEEILRADTECRKRLGWGAWGGSANQPWCLPAISPEHTITLKFKINSDIEVKDAKLALEMAEKSVITFNGATVPSEVNGYFVDKAIKTVSLPVIPVGTSELVLVQPFGHRTATEWCYILGDFGVRVEGMKKTITRLPEKLGFGSITTQGLPFYSGKLTYEFDFLNETEGNGIEVKLHQYRAALYEVSIDGDEPTTGAFAPYVVRRHSLSAGKHTVSATLYINRTNAFSHVHCSDPTLSYPSPAAWRTSGDRWCYEYRLKDEGILVTPRLAVIDNSSSN